MKKEKHLQVMSFTCVAELKSLQPTLGQNTDADLIITTSSKHLNGHI